MKLDNFQSPSSFHSDFLPSLNSGFLLQIILPQFHNYLSILVLFFLVNPLIIIHSFNSPYVFGSFGGDFVGLLLKLFEHVPSFSLSLWSSSPSLSSSHSNISRLISSFVMPQSQISSSSSKMTYLSTIIFFEIGSYNLHALFLL